MRGLAWGPYLALALALALGACAPDAASNATALCTVVCRCTAGSLPSQQRECVEQCEQDSDVRQASDACVQCVFINSNSCSTLLQQCAGECSRAEPTPDDGSPPDARTNVDVN